MAGNVVAMRPKAHFEDEETTVKNRQLKFAFKKCKFFIDFRLEQILKLSKYDKSNNPRRINLVL